MKMFGPAFARTVANANRRQACGLLLPLLLGILLGGVVMYNLPRFLQQGKVRQPEAEPRDWLNDGLPPTWTIYDAPCAWSYMRIGQGGWFTQPLQSLSDLQPLINSSAQELVIPIFPSVFTPFNDERRYFDLIYESVGQDDKVLVIGTGSGCDAWVASLRSRRPIHVMDINPMAIANTQVTARLGGFEVVPLLGDIRRAKLPESFSEFDFVLWNMPFLVADGDEESLGARQYHDGDDGGILRAFLELLPTLLSEDGKAIIINTVEAQSMLGPGWVAKDEVAALVLIYVFSNENP